MAKWIELQSGQIIDADQLQVIGRQGINEYVLVLKQCPVTMTVTGVDVDVLRAFLGVEKLEYPEVVETPKLVKPA